MQLKNSNTIRTYKCLHYLDESGNFERDLKIDDVDADQVKNISFIVDIYTYKSNARIVTFKNLAIIQKKSASLLVDGTITSTHLKSKIIASHHIETDAIEAIHIKSNSITADKMLIDEAFINKLLVNNLLVDKITSNYAFINTILTTDIDATRIKSGYLSGDRIYGGIIQGVTLKGLDKIMIGQYGFLQPISNGLQINAPANYNASYGVGVQIFGSPKGDRGNGSYIPYGLYIYKDQDFNNSNALPPATDEYLLHVQGFVNARGLGYLRLGTSTVDGSKTGTLSYYSSNNVALALGGGNDIYYTYNGTAYSLWNVITRNSSDVKLKTNIKVSNHSALNVIKQLSFKEFDWIKDGDREQKPHTKIGLIAQEVEKIDSTLVKSNGDRLSLDDFRLLHIGLKATQELDFKFELKISKLEKEVEALKNEISELRSAA